MACFNLITIKDDGGKTQAGTKRAVAKKDDAHIHTCIHAEIHICRKQGMRKENE